MRCGQERRPWWMNLCGVIVLLNVVIISLSHPCLNFYPSVIKVQSVSLTHTHTHACATIHARTYMHARTHTHTLTQSLSSISAGNCLMTTHADTHTGRLRITKWFNIVCSYACIQKKKKEKRVLMIHSLHLVSQQTQE